MGFSLNFKNYVNIRVTSQLGDVDVPFGVMSFDLLCDLHLSAIMFFLFNITHIWQTMPYS